MECGHPRACWCRRPLGPATCTGDPGYCIMCAAERRIAALEECLREMVAKAVPLSACIYCWHTIDHARGCPVRRAEELLDG